MNKKYERKVAPKKKKETVDEGDSDDDDADNNEVIASLRRESEELKRALDKLKKQNSNLVNLKTVQPTPTPKPKATPPPKAAGKVNDWGVGTNEHVNSHFIILMHHSGKETTTKSSR